MATQKKEKVDYPPKGSHVARAELSNGMMARFTIEIADGQGGFRFGGGCDVRIDGWERVYHARSKGKPFEATVQVGGVTAHDTEFGYQRAEGLRIGCSIADRLHAIASLAKRDGSNAPVGDAWWAVVGERNLTVTHEKSDLTSAFAEGQVW